MRCNNRTQQKKILLVAMGSVVSEVYVVSPWEFAWGWLALEGDLRETQELRASSPLPVP